MLVVNVERHAKLGKIFLNVSTQATCLGVQILDEKLLVALGRKIAEHITSEAAHHYLGKAIGYLRGRLSPLGAKPGGIRQRE